MLRSASVTASCASRSACLGLPALRSRAGLRRARLVASALDPHSVAATASSMVDAAHHLPNVLATLADAAPAVPPAQESGGGMDFLADGFESLLKLIDAGLEKANVPYSYGFAIITLTLLVKLATFPLSQKQVESSIAVQALQPRVKELQAKYSNEPETLQLETARLYKEAGVNPLAGCLPTLATIPVFIGLYKALSKAADEGLGQEAFFWIPDLSGPATLTQRTEGAGLSWLFPFVDGHPPIGWGNAGAYLVLPVMLVASQYLSMKIVSPPQNKDDPAAQQSQAILKFLPLMIGWFSLNVPSGLTLYWFVNNILSTGQQLYLKSSVKVNIPEPKVTAPVGTIVKPKEERVKKVTGKELGSRRRRNDDGSEIIDVEGEVVSSSSEQHSTPAQQQQQGGSRGKGDKFRALKAREAAGKAAEAATSHVVDSRKD